MLNKNLISFSYLLLSFSFAQNSQSKRFFRSTADTEAPISHQKKEVETPDNHFVKTLMDPKVLDSFADAMIDARAYITDNGAYPYKTYSIHTAEGRFVMRSMTYRVAKALKNQASIADYFTLTNKVENIFHELRFENLVVKEHDKIKTNLFRTYFRLKYPDSEKSFVYMMEWDPQDKSPEALKIFHIPNASDARNIGDGAERIRIGQDREHHKAISRAVERLKASSK